MGYMAQLVHFLVRAYQEENNSEKEQQGRDRAWCVALPGQQHAQLIEDQ